MLGLLSDPNVWEIRDCRRVSAAMIAATVSSISPDASPWRTLCLLAAASTGSGQLKYCLVTCCRSSITSSMDGMFRPVWLKCVFPTAVSSLRSEFCFSSVLGLSS